MTSTDTLQQLKQLTGMPASTFVLHRPPMLFLDRLVNIGEDFATCEWCIREDSAFITPDHGVPGYAGVEYMAQCIAVHAGARARIRGFVPPVGYLLGTRHYKCSVPCFDAGVTYQNSCRELVRDSQGMGSFACTIMLEGETIAQANLAVLERPQEIRLDE